MTHTYFVKAEQRTLFSHTHTHTRVSISLCYNGSRMIQLMAKSDSLMDLVFPYDYGTD